MKRKGKKIVRLNIHTCKRTFPFSLMFDKTGSIKLNHASNFLVIYMYKSIQATCGYWITINTVEILLWLMWITNSKLWLAFQSPKKKAAEFPLPKFQDWIDNTNSRISEKRKQFQLQVLSHKSKTDCQWHSSTWWWSKT